MWSRILATKHPRSEIIDSEEMMESRNQCPKCNGEMKQGFILDHKDYASALVTQWQPGEPQKSFWRGVKSKDGPQYEITAYRCTGCGYLESYAK